MTEIDLHGYHPHTIEGMTIIEDVVPQAWEMGAAELRLIHGHALGRAAIQRPFAYTNTGYLGLTIRSTLRHNAGLRRWMFVKIDVTDPGYTTIRLRPNPAPTRTSWDKLPEPDFSQRF